MKSLFLLLGALVLAGPCPGRTWTSANGDKQFTADFVSSEAETITVLRNGKKVTFKISLLSEDDQAWIESEAERAQQAEEAKKAAADFAESDFGKSFKKLQILKGKRLTRRKLETAPKFFLLYFSASW